MGNGTRPLFHRNHSGIVSGRTARMVLRVPPGQARIRGHHLFANSCPQGHPTAPSPAGTEAMDVRPGRPIQPEWLMTVVAQNRSCGGVVRHPLQHYATTCSNRSHSPWPPGHYRPRLLPPLRARLHSVTVHVLRATPSTVIACGSPCSRSAFNPPPSVHPLPVIHTRPPGFNSSSGGEATDFFAVSKTCELAPCMSTRRGQRADGTRHTVLEYRSRWRSCGHEARAL